MENTYIEGLATQARRGDINALMTLCKTIVGGVYFRVSCILDNHMDVEDVAQEVLFRVCTKIKELNDPKAFNAWLGTIIVNESRRQLSRNSKHIVFDIDDYANIEFEEDEECLPHEYIEKEESRDSVMGAIKLLPERQREAVVLHYYDEMSITDTAKTMGVTQQAASLYLKLARERIRDKIDDHAVAETPACLQSVAVMPLGGFITHNMQNEAVIFIQANKGQTQQAINGCTTYIKGIAAKSATAPIAVPAGLKIGIVAVMVAVGIGIVAGNAPSQSGPQAANDTYIEVPSNNAEGDLAFSGGDSPYPYLNPRHADPISNSDYGDLIAQNWRIIASGSSAVLYSGDGDNADGALAAMQERGEDGEYILYFFMEDTLGNKYTLDSNFFIRTRG